MKIAIKSSCREYVAVFHHSLSKVLSELTELNGKALCVIDQNIIRLYPDFTKELSDKFPVFAFTATEENKTLDGLSDIVQRMKEEGLNKFSRLIVIGGGITQDACALAASLYYRGIDYVLVPTTLLAMADSCIGSKSGLNFNQYKNQLGAFYPPSQVMVCCEFIETLSAQERLSGLGEVLKLFYIGKCADDFNLQQLQSDQSSLLEAIYRALLIKKDYIEQDEFDVGLRRTLNYGHTFGHVIESLTDYGVPHGLAVVIGMDVVNYISLQQGILTEASFDAIHDDLRLFYPWESLNIAIDFTKILSAVKSDKKVKDNKLTFALLTEKDGCVLRPLMLNAELESQLFDYKEKYFVDFARSSAKLIG